MPAQATRFAPPVISEKCIKRRGLIKQLERIPLRSIVYIHAPAGYGKTTLAAEWLADTKKSSAWLALDEYSATSSEIYKGILHALSCQAYDSAVHTTLEYTLNILSAHNNWPQVLVIDDFHLCSDMEVSKALPVIRGRLPENMAFMVISRNPPHDILGEHVVKGSVRQITDLQFDNYEIAELFIKNDLSISTHYAKLLKKQTDGWAAALSAILMAGNYKAHYDLLDQDTLNHYLKSSIFEFHGDFDILKKCSVSDLLYPSLCDTVAGREGAWNVIEALAKKTGLVIRLSERAYRFHTLLREFLLAEMESDKSLNKMELYINAANWFMKDGDRFRALHMAAKSEDNPKMDEIMRVLWGEYGNDHMDMDAYVHYIEKYLLPIPNHISSRYPRISMQCFPGVLHCRPIAEVHYWLDVLETHMRERRYHPDDYLLATFMLAIDPRRSSWNVPKQFEKLRDIMTGLGNRNPRMFSITENLPFFHKAQRDYTDVAAEVTAFSAEIEKQMKPFLGPVFSPLAMLFEAGIYYETGNFERAEHTASRAVEFTKNHSPEIRFCAYALYYEILRLTGKPFRLKHIGSMIEQTKASYLLANYGAIEADTRLYNGDKDIAGQFLKKYEPDDILKLYKIAQYFTVVRAMIVLNKFQDAFKLLERLIDFSQDFRRNADNVEAKALQSICCLYMSRHDEAVTIMLSAIQKAAELQIITPISKNGNDVVPILKKILNRLKHGYGTDVLDKGFVNNLFIQAKTISLYVRGMLSRNETVVIKLSPRQEEMLNYLARNFTYQEISDKTGIKITTVRDHITKLYEKLGVSTATDAVMKARELSILK